MQQIAVSSDSVAIWLTGERLSGRDSVTRLVQSVLSENNLPLWPRVEAECYQCGEDTLILARPAPAPPMSFYFKNLEDLLSAVFSCKDGESSLYRLEAGYLLVVPPEQIPLPLYEYGNGYPLTPLWPVHGKEQGMCLMEGRAIGDLKRFFSTFGV